MKNRLLQRNNLAVSITFVGALFFFSLSGIVTLYAQEEEKPCPKPYVKTISPKAAKPGDEVKIRGSRFGKQGGFVTFAPGVRASIKEWKFKRIYVVVPGGAKTGPVIVTSHCGETSNEDHFTIKTTEE